MAIKRGAFARWSTAEFSREDKTAPGGLRHMRQEKKMKRLFNFMAMLGLMVGLLASTDARSDGLVLTLEGGASFAGDTGLMDVDTFIGTWDRDSNMGTGYVIGALAGYEWTDIGGGRLRLGLLGNYRSGFDADNDINFADSVDLGYGFVLGAEAKIEQSADISSLSGVLAGEYDFTQYAMKGEGYTIYFTVGAGVGAAVNYIDKQRLTQTERLFLTKDGELVDQITAKLGCDGGDDSNTNVAWHLQGGVGGDIGDNVAVQVVYRYVDLGSVDTTDKLSCTTSINGNTVDTSSVAIKSEEIDLRNHEVLGRVSYRF